MKFNLTCYVYKRPNLRKFECGIFDNFNVFRTLFDEVTVDTEPTSVTFHFPERWLNIVEQRQLYERIERYLPNVTEVIVHTHSVFIIQASPQGSVQVVD